MNAAGSDIDKFQNILCYCLTQIHLDLFLYQSISKHPMLLFNHKILSALHILLFISKHPMLLFNYECIFGIAYTIKISKHPMLLFN